MGASEGSVSHKSRVLIFLLCILNPVLLLPCNTKINHNSSDFSKLGGGAGDMPDLGGDEEGLDDEDEDMPTLEEDGTGAEVDGKGKETEAEGKPASKIEELS